MKKQSLADILAMVSFSILVGLFVELGVLHMTLNQSLRSRVMSIPLNILTARPYGIYRDWIIRTLEAALPNSHSKFAGDILAFCSFQVPLYILILVSSGASVSQALQGSVVVIFVSLLSGRPYGIFLDFFRRLLNSRELPQKR